MYYKKYLKYKIKYLDLKNKQLLKIQEGGNFPLGLITGTVTFGLISLLGLVYKYTDNKTDEYDMFIKNIFIFLKKYSICFLSGTLILEDNNNRLFNILTNNIDSQDKCLQNDKIIHTTLTHNDVLKKKDVKTDNCLKFNKYNKLQIIFNSPIYYLCDQETQIKDIDNNNNSMKTVLLYYRFHYNNKNYIFFKLEKHNMNTLGHVIDFFNKKRVDKYENRREDKKYINSYNDQLKSEDLKFYNKLVSDNIIPDNNISEKLNFYDDNLRTGRELFIIEELKNYFLDNFWEKKIK